MLIPSMQELLEAGVHFGHQVRRWNPKMRPYIFTAREGVHVIDLEKTFAKLAEACDFVKSIGEGGGVMIFLASKKQARSIIVEEATRAGAKYVVERWIGGLLTNWELTSKNIKKLVDLKAKKEAGEFKERTKKENLLIDREIAKLQRLYGGVEDLEKLPDAIFVVDVRKEENACREALKKEIPVVAIADTNANLDLVTYPIPGNDDAIKAIKVICAAVADSYLEGRQAFEKKSAREKLEADKKAAIAEKAAAKASEDKTSGN
ncbi:30S ribosomal protein S2 [Candidatus Curtissbacteria bacterium RIFCSPHIGHO2_01_FULL_41_11]|uniref:Small ribosomal subunit protein uS2 n=1 Tax=Candidatus Curtissbacteria bacterium RIFCSPHIGHO2_01_FULL_41_11 TaxID=1797711 RepID=A0A1F5G639_9BACT|nr:MAG: 30S ribosomal protein S2 [Candidatus Curtissbacteria bacterium RIFCSPHIGHO2_01_FULL_41_11]